MMDIGQLSNIINFKFDKVEYVLVEIEVKDD